MTMSGCSVRARSSSRALSRLVPLLFAVLPLAAACGPGTSPQPTVTVTVPPSSGPGGSPSSAPAAAEPGIVAVTTSGSLVRLDPATGSVTQTLVASGGAIGDEIAVSPDKSTIYYAQRSGCTLTVMSVSASGGTPTPVAPGELPAISPDGSKLAFAQEPLLSTACTPTSPDLAADFKLVIRNLSSGAQTTLPQPPQVVSGGLFQPISHLSWAADSTRLAVSISAVQDNEGWGVNVVDTSVAHYYTQPATGVTTVPVTGSPSAQRSYLREGAFLPDGNLFVSRACCGGFPVRNTSRLMWEVSTSGSLVHQVAIGYPSLDHVGLAADPSGQWLLYLAGTDLYVSQGGNRPSKLAGGIAAAAWM